MHLTDNTINEIVGDLESGFVCYIHKKKDKYLKLPNVDFDEYYDATDEDLTKTKTYKKLQKKGHKYITIKPQESYEAYQIMEKFVATLEDKDVQVKFTELLNKKRPFSNFKTNLNIYGLLNDWYAFKTSEYKAFFVERMSLKS